MIKQKLIGTLSSFSLFAGCLYRALLKLLLPLTVRSHFFGEETDNITVKLFYLVGVVKASSMLQPWSIRQYSVLL